jgi:hypothetical protein
VQALDKEQIADIRQRLNVDVVVPEGEPEAWAPIESFKDMVSFRRPTAAAATLCLLHQAGCGPCLPAWMLYAVL